MRAVAPVLLDGVEVKPYPAIDSVHTDPLDPLPAFEHAALLSDFPADAVDALVAAAGPGSGSEQILVELRQMGGAYARGGEHDSAFRQRHARYSLLTVGMPGPGVEENARGMSAALAPWVIEGSLPNFTFKAEDFPAAYDAQTLARLRAAITTYDPQGVIALGHALRG
jgi:hypothetical protein